MEAEPKRLRERLFTAPVLVDDVDAGDATNITLVPTLEPENEVAT